MKRPIADLDEANRLQVSRSQDVGVESSLLSAIVQPRSRCGGSQADGIRVTTSLVEYTLRAPEAVFCAAARRWDLCGTWGGEILA